MLKNGIRCGYINKGRTAHEYAGRKRYIRIERFTGRAAFVYPPDLADAKRK